MKPSERISEIYNKLREEHGIIFAPPDLYSKAISIYIDEEWEQKQIAKEIMTNNNLEEKFENLIKDCYPEEVFGKVDSSLMPKDEVMAAAMRAMAKSIGYIVSPVVLDLLAKKDQEHKAELEAIRAEIEDGRIQDSELEHFLTVVAHNDVIDDNILILDKHINK